MCMRAGDGGGGSAICGPLGRSERRSTSIVVVAEREKSRQPVVPTESIGRPPVPVRPESESVTDSIARVGAHGARGSERRGDGECTRHSLAGSAGGFGRVHQWVLSAGLAGGSD